MWVLKERPGSQPGALQVQKMKSGRADPSPGLVFWPPPVPARDSQLTHSVVLLCAAL